jgi:hypothetical protein
MHAIFGTAFFLLCLTSLQGPSSETTNPPDDQKDQLLSGRVLDGLGRPVPGASVRIMRLDPGPESSLTVVLTGKDGRFSCSIAKEFESIRYSIRKEEYVNSSGGLDLPDMKDFTLRHIVDWGKTSTLLYREEGELDDGMRELLASEEEYGSAGELLRFIFKHQFFLCLAMRRLVKDPMVGKDAMYWLDKLGDSGDGDLFPEGRKYAPKHEIGEEDLVEAIKAISGRLNFFSDAPEPKIDIGSITFTPKMDRALVKCGINLAGLTGVLWEFVFHKEGKRWVLRSMEEVGRG